MYDAQHMTGARRPSSRSLNAVFVGVLCTLLLACDIELAPARLAPTSEAPAPTVQVEVPPTPIPPTNTPTVPPTAVPQPTDTPAPPSPSATPSATTPAVLYVGNTEGDGVYLRRSPQLADRLKAWPDGTALLVIEADVEGEGGRWRRVRLPDGTEGYVPAQYTLSTVTPTATSPPATPTPLRRPDDLRQVLVLEVVDGDTVEVQFGGEVARLRLLGIDAPETVAPGQPVQCFGPEAALKVHELLSGQVLALEADPSQGERDADGRLLRFAWLTDGRLANHELLVQGYAHAVSTAPPHRYQADFLLAEQQARDQARGFWAPDTCAGDTTRPANQTTLGPITSPTSTLQISAVLTPVTPTQAPVVRIASATPAATQTATPTPQPTPLAITDQPGTVARGSPVSVAAQVMPGAPCLITVVYDSGPSRAAGLQPKVADAEGEVAWSWTVETAAPVGRWPVHILCGRQSGTTYLTVP
ncbi:MAG: hypothetical protein CL878_14650 [Dehalococcoidia bacterium]|nr:hypothetical protein [Dehalococcoidia bacterium]